MILCTSTAVSAVEAAWLSSHLEQDVVVSCIRDLSCDLRQSVEVVLTFGNYEDVLTEQDVAQLPSLRWIQSMSSGVEDLPLDHLRERAIIVTSAQGVQAEPIAEYAIGMILYFAKRLDHFQRMQAARAWDVRTDTGEIKGKTLGILGTGSIGQAIANRALPFGMTVMGVNRTGHPVSCFEQVYSVDDVRTLLAMCDYVCAALPSTLATRGLMGWKAFAAMRDGAYFINVGRGDLVVDAAMVAAIQKGKLAGAALDVFQEEPLPSHHVFWKQPSIVLTPHVASRTAQYIPRILRLFLANYRCFQDERYEAMTNLV